MTTHRLWCVQMQDDQEVLECTCERRKGERRVRDRNSWAMPGRVTLAPTGVHAYKRKGSVGYWECSRTGIDRRRDEG